VAREREEGEVAVGSLSIWHWLIVGAVVLLVFGGKGKISDIMGDVAKGIKSFKKGLAEEDAKPEPPVSTDPVRNLEHSNGTETAKVSDPRRVV
jgi:sec-independent protein translocase protein TatA